MILPYNGKQPQIDSTAFIASNATVTGSVTIGAKSSVFFGAVIRGDVNDTIIGNGVNVQDLCVLHQSPSFPLILEDGVTVGHSVILHSCTVRKNALIGMGSIILDGAEIGEGAMIGAGSLVPGGKVIPPNSLAFGRPAKVVRELTKEDIDDMNRIRREYVEKGQYYKSVESNHSPQS
ncbi:gamma carbonic anhydrase [Gottfriedia solisilvae]|uniref:Gamma carbonic anhydrase family protein n=1 Tax=Gottfriedia solisilvae TaxID=1516104 RepID=A0A8J3AIM0_9BACI|nr:gamma carbonic anhydrase family protein [Gottfriedia solisilvae]GGI09955.1 gamma carbonic anhydrase family protein [Gottfriedia solisilvae]